jgi:HSP20 family molecular chaperone IbpA
MTNDDPCGSPQHLPVNMFEASEAIVVVAPMSAVQPDDVRVSVEGRTLTIRADCRTEAPRDYLLHEWHYGPYERTLELPEGFGAGGEGTLGNGQLALRILKGDGAGTVIVPVVKP